MNWMNFCAGNMWKYRNILTKTHLALGLQILCFHSIMVQSISDFKKRKAKQDQIAFCIGDATKKEKE